MWSRHEKLRTVFPGGRRGPSAALVIERGGQILAPAFLSSMPPHGRLTGWAIGGGARLRFGEPGYLCGWLSGSPTTNMCWWRLHHIAAGGWSGGSAAAISTAYASRCAGRAPDWAPLPVQYVDYTWQQEIYVISTTATARSPQLAYWKMLANAQLRLLPLSFITTVADRRQFGGGLAGVVLLEGASDRPPAQRSQPFVVVAAGFAVLLSKLSREAPMWRSVSHRRPQRSCAE